MRRLASRFDPRARFYKGVRLSELIEIATASPFLTLTTLTEPSWISRSPKVNPFYGEVWKLARINIEACIDYKDWINRRRRSEGKPASFEAKPRKWGSRLIKLPIVEHTKHGEGWLYLSCWALESLNYEYHTVNHTIINKKVVDPYVRQPQTPDYYGLDSEAIYREYRLDHIVAVVKGSRGFVLTE